MADEFGSKEWFEQFQKMWNPMNFPFPGIVQPTLDPEEIERKIALGMTLLGSVFLIRCQIGCPLP